MSTEQRTPTRRWRLHRGGIVNIWQYAEHTFDLSGGRAIFQGTNGSGKSRTLELLLPLCLDGDLRQLGSKGFDTVSVRRLMLDEYPGGPNRIGYAWVELSRETPEGGEEFLTCGIGIKAAKTSQSITDSWRFCTPLRVGRNLHLVGPDRVPLGAAQLRDAVGADAVLDEQAFRSKIAATVYGMPSGRYGDLLHLQRTLRNPDVGLKVLEGQLEQILSDALPPLDSGLVERLATSFDDLESIRTNIIRLSSADSALRGFLRDYSDYAFGMLRTKAQVMRTATHRANSLRTELDTLRGQLDTTRADRQSAQHTIAELEKRENELESSIDALRAHPAYTELQNLRDRQRLVDSTHTAAVTALDTASRHRSQEDRSAESVVGTLRRLTGDAEAAEQAAHRANRQLVLAGLDGDLVPRPPSIPAAEINTISEQVRADPDPEAEPFTVDRQLTPQVDSATLATSLRTTAQESEQAATFAKQRCALILALHQQALALDAEQGTVTDLQRQAKQAQLTATETAGRRNQAQQELADTAHDWAARAHEWLANWPESTSDSVTIPAATQLIADRGASRNARERVRAWAGPRLRQARQHSAEAQHHLAQLRQRYSATETEHADRRAGSEPASTQDRARGVDGSPFYRLVDFRSSVPDDARAGLEAALEASGLLAAWVTSDGSCVELPDPVAEPTECHTGRTLVDLLQPAAEPGCPVPAERIVALLESVSTNQAPGFSVSTTGEWRAGVLTGRGHKDAAEYVGAGAREDARAKRIAELENSLAELRTHVADAEKTHQAALDEVGRIERYLESFPDDGELLTAHAKLATAIETAEDSGQQAARLREQHERADERGQAAKAELVHATGAAELPSDSHLLEAAHRAATEADAAIESLLEVIESRCLPTLADFREQSLHHDAAVADRMEAESQAEQRCAEYAEHAAALSELTAAVDGAAHEVADSITDLEQQRGDLRGQLPKARERAAQLREKTARLETQWENKNAQLPAREADADSATEHFRAISRAPGLWAVARVSEQDESMDLTDAAEIVTTADARKNISESTVLSALQELRTAVSGDYDVSAHNTHGVLTVTVTGTEGPRSVFEQARRVASHLDQQRGYLNERYQEIFADYLIRDLAERLRDQITIAENLCARMNEVLDGARSSQGVHVRLEWQPAAGLSEDIRQAIDVVRTSFADRSEQQDVLLRRVFTTLIESERDSAAGGYADILARALDYRSWFSFTVRVRDTGPEGKARVRRLRQLSSGETRLVSYVTLFAAAAAFYDAVSVSTGQQAPLRLVLLDEAFERLDDPTVARMLGLLVDLDMDWMITWPSGWGVSPKIPTMHIYDILRPRSGHGIACTHTVWNGHDLDLTD